MKFRYDINALRAIAVISVLLFHYKAPYFGGGFCGVDVFFVISGYLMTHIIASAIVNNNFLLKDFYIKRLKRIVPALLVLIIVVTGIGFFINFPVDYVVMEKNAVASMLFVSNISYLQSSNYFAPSSDTNVLLHTWSLSVEWQFYLIYPIALYFLNKLIKNKTTYLSFFLAVTVLICIASFIITRFDATSSFYLLPTRSWEMLAGGVAFYTENSIKKFKRSFLIALPGYALILYSTLFLHKQLPWPGVYTLMPVLGTFMVIVANWSDLSIAKWGIVQFFGKISYSLYLWHWPVYVIATYVGISKSITTLPLLIVLSIILAFFSYRFIETRHYNSSRKILLLIGGISTVIIISILTDANRIRFKSRSLQLSGYANSHKSELDKQFSTGKCFMSTGNTAKDFDRQQCLCLSDSLKNILLIGDSHAAQLSETFRESFSKMNIQLSQATASGCLPILRANGQNRCKDVINYIYHDFIVKNASKINGIIICANWVDSNDDSNVLLNDIQATLQFLRKYNLKTIIVGQNETYTMPYPYIAAWENELNMKLSGKFITTRSDRVNRMLSGALKPYYVDVYNKDRLPGLSPNDIPYMFDDHHVTNYGASLILQKVFKDTVASTFFHTIMN